MRPGPEGPRMREGGENAGDDGRGFNEAGAGRPRMRFGAI